ncbi:secretion system protein [Candidatus Saccharibacteria bacterium 49-20]|nr:MAG: secretion system protein [Candidatus Saccharibacteria bacterium 49-20]
MARFSYSAADSQNNIVKGKTELPDRTAVITALAKQGLRPISIKKLKDSKSSFDFDHLFESTKVKQDQLVAFTRQLSAMVSAGVPLLRSLTSIQKHAEDKALQKILADVVKDVEGGMPLGDALAKHPDTFNDIYVNMVRAGETAGILDDILKRLAGQLEKSAAMRKKIKSAMTYPMVLLGITVLAFFGLMLFVVPQIGKIIGDLGGPDAKLPGLTVAMLAISNFIVTFWYIVFPVLIGAIVALVMYVRKSPKGKRQFDTLALKVPAVSSIVRKVCVARFSRTFSALMGAGVAVLEALDVTSRAVGNTLFQEALQQAAIEVKNGKSLSSVIEQNELFPSIVSQMLAVGEETGQTDTVLIKVADFYEEEVDLAIDGISSIIEPVMIVVMGGMVGLIAASVMMPIAGLSSQIK